jgi:prevent-host-death family protein
MAEARRNWARVLRTAERGAAVEVTRNGQVVAAVVPIDDYREIASRRRATLSEVVAKIRAGVDPRDLEGPDPWAGVRDRSPGRAVDLG